MHSHIVVSPDETDMEAVHLFRFEGDKIVGLRDGGQPVPADSPHTDSMFWDGGIIMTGDKSKAQAPEQAPRRNPTLRHLEVLIG